VKEMQKELEQRDFELQQAAKEKAEYQSIVEKQEVNLSDMERMQQEKSNLEEQSNAAVAARESLEKSVYDKEIQISKKLEELEKYVQQYNSTSRKLKLAPSNAKHAHGVDYLLAFNSHIPDSCLESIKNFVKSGLEKLTAEFSKGAIAGQDELLTYQEKVDKSEEIAADKKEEVSNLEGKLAKLKNTYKKEKEAMNEKVKQKQLEIDSVHQEINKLKDQSNENLANSRKSAEKLNQEYESLVQICQLEREEMNKVLLDTVDLLLSHRTHIQKNLEALQQYYTTTKNNLSLQLQSTQ